eukprot:gene9715-10746_t
MALRVGLFGAGIVGGGVIELLQKYSINGKLLQLGSQIEIVKVCVRSVEKARDFTLPSHTELVTNYNDILDDPSINCIVELMGGVTHAKDVVFRAIQANKHVVTANKALIATFLPELQAELAKHPSVKFAYEAAVCGGIPIIHTLQTDFVLDRISKVMGIMNGTTNFMLTKMEEENADYHQALAEAQALGYAEADPTADVEGHDVQAKIALLAKLAFGKTVPVQSIPTNGISKLTSSDFHYAKLLDSTIKLIGTANRNEDGSLAVFVNPSLVSRQNPFSTAKGSGNMVVVRSENLQSSTFAGPGAGRFPTANSVVNDLVRLSIGQQVPPFPYEEEGIALNSDYTASFYLRLLDPPGDFERLLNERASAAGLEVKVLHADAKEVACVVASTTVAKLTGFLKNLESHHVQTALYMPIL